MELIDRDELRKKAEAIIEDSASTKAWAILYEIDNAPAVEGVSDYISRQAAIDALANMHCKSDEDGYVWIIRSDAWARIDALPSAQPEQRWIPCSERLPEGGWNIVSRTITEDGDKWVGLRWYSSEHGWEWGEQPDAWMSLPEPWKGEQP